MSSHDLTPVQYTRLGQDVIAYRDFGGAGTPLVYLGTNGSHQDLMWEESGYAHFLRRLAVLGRLITFDRRGSGLSSHVRKPTIDSRVEDIGHVLDIAGVSEAVIFAAAGSCQAALVFAASFPGRCRALVLYAPAARMVQGPDYDIGTPADVVQLSIDEAEAAWGTGLTAWLYLPSLSQDRDVVEWCARHERAIATPVEVADWVRMYAETDIRDVLQFVRAPALIAVPTHATDPVPALARYVAERLDHGVTIELDARDQFPFGDGMTEFLAAIDEFLPSVVDVGFDATEGRRLAAILFTDVVASTEHLRSVGDRQWRVMLDSHDEVVGHAVARRGGRVVKSTGDGALALFDGPAKAVLAGLDVQAGLARMGLSARAGVHFGEVEDRRADVAGIAIHIASRVADLAAPGDVLVTGVVRDLVAGSGLRLDDRGPHHLKGFDDDVMLLAASRTPPPV